jgi:hypothetical protein
LQIEYVDANGIRTHRQVTVHQITGAGEPEQVVAVCSLWDRARSFRLDRIAGLVDLSSGEIIADPASYARQITAERGGVTAPVVPRRAHIDRIRSDLASRNPRPMVVSPSGGTAMSLYRCYVSPVDSRWRLTIRGRKYSPCATHRRAIAVAIDAAQYAASRGNAAEVLVTDNRRMRRPV